MLLEIARARLQADPEDRDALFTLAAALATVDDPRGAVRALERLETIDPDYPGLWAFEMKLFARLGDAERWQRSRHRALASPTDEGAAAPTACPFCKEAVPPGSVQCPHCMADLREESEVLRGLEDRVRVSVPPTVPPPFESVPPPAVPAAPPGTIPCPLCNSPVPADEAHCPMCNARLREDAELLRAVEDRVRDASPATPAAKAAVLRPVPRAKGMTNGLVLEKRALRPVPVAKPGRVNGLRGRTNGLTNGRGRTNGLTNGLRGRTNGLTNGLGRTNGLTNGVGRTNGLTNGVGRTNGLSKGLERAARSRGFLPGSVPRWQRLALPVVLIALVILLPLVFFWSAPVTNYPIRVDGNFADWASVSKVATVPPAAANPDTDLTHVALADNVDFLAFYLEVRGNVLSGQTAGGRVTNAYYAFVDVDRSRATGYQVQGIGADRLIAIETWGGNVVGTSVMEFDSSHGPRDWSGWISAGNAQAAGSGGQLEFQVPWVALGVSHGPVQVAFASRSWDGQSDAADVVITDAVPYVLVTQNTRAPSILTNATPVLATFRFHAVAADVSVVALNVTFQGTFRSSSLASVSLVDEGGNTLGTHPVAAVVTFTLPGFVVPRGGNRSLSLRSSVLAADATTVAALITNLNDVVPASGGVAFGGPVRVASSFAYVGTIPNVPMIDGGFADWTTTSSDPIGDVQPIPNPDVDLNGYAFRGSSGSAYFMAAVAGTALNGTMVPMGNPSYTPPANGTGNGTVSPPPPPENGTDAMRIFLDQDGSAATGYSIGGVGADYLIEITGKEGLILSSRAMRFSGASPWSWTWTDLGAAPTAKDASRIEAALPGVAIANASRAYFSTTGWGGSRDDSSPAAPFATLGVPVLVRTLSTPTSTPQTLSTLTSGTGAAAGDNYGFNVTGLGRITSASGNYESFAITAPYASGGKGAIYLFFGYAGWAPANINAGSANVTLIGDATGDHLGWSIAPAGDVNGDGIADFLVGAPDAGAGKAYLVYGRTSWTGVSGAAIGSVANVVTIVGQVSGDKFGSSVAGLGNVNNAGNADIGVGAPGYASNKGRVYVFYDNSTMPTKASQASLFLDGGAAGDRFGLSLAGAGNVNGDSYSDFVVGAPGANKAYVYTTGINPVSNGFLTASANGWTYGEVDVNGYDSGAWDNTGGSLADSSGAGSYKFTFADAGSSLTLTFHAETATENTKTTFALLTSSTDLTLAASSTVTASAVGQHLILGNWTTPALGITQITAGTWTFTYDLSAGPGVSAAQVDVHIYKLSSTGTLTAIDGTNGLDATLGVATTVNITTPTTYTGTYSMPATPVLTTDAIYIRVYAHILALGGVNQRTVTFSYDANGAPSTLAFTASFPETRYFHVESATVNGFTDQELLTALPDHAGTGAGSASFTATSTGHFLLGEWTLPQMEIPWIRSGDWNFYYWGTTQAQDGRFDVHVYKRPASGGTYSVDGTNGANATVGVASTGSVGGGGSPAQYSGSVRLNSIALNVTDAIVVRVYVNVVTLGNGGGKTTTFDYDNSAANAPNSRFVYPGQTYTDRAYILSSASFTSPAGSYTNVRYRFSYTSTVTTIGDAFYKVKYQIMNASGASTVARPYDSGNLTTAQAWSLQTGTFSGLSASTSYRVRVMLEVYDINAGQTPSLTLNVDDIDLQFETVTTLTGTAGTNFGWSVAIVASGTGYTSFNNDAYADVLVGAPNTANGQVTVYYGSASFSSTAAVTITGAASGDKFGYTVSSAADFNADGIADLVIGAPYHTNGGATAAGAVYVFTGSSSPPASMTTANAFDSTFGETANDHYGWSVSYSHPNGASASLLLVGAPNYSSPNANEGKAYVVAVPEFQDLVLPVATVLLCVLGLGARSRRRDDAP